MKIQNYQFTNTLPLAYLYQTDNPNHCWGRYLQLGERSPKLDAIIIFDAPKAMLPHPAPTINAVPRNSATQRRSMDER